MIMDLDWLWAKSRLRRHSRSQMVGMRVRELGGATDMDDTSYDSCSFNGINGKVFTALVIQKYKETLCIPLSPSFTKRDVCS